MTIERSVLKHRARAFLASFTSPLMSLTGTMGGNNWGDWHGGNHAYIVGSPAMIKG